MVTLEFSSDKVYPLFTFKKVLSFLMVYFRQMKLNITCISSSCLPQRLQAAA